jgi:hypothetical protein
MIAFAQVCVFSGSNSSLNPIDLRDAGESNLKMTRSEPYPRAQCELIGTDDDFFREHAREDKDEDNGHDDVRKPSCPATFLFEESAEGIEKNAA